MPVKKLPSLAVGNKGQESVYYFKLMIDCKEYLIFSEPKGKVQGLVEKSIKYVNCTYVKLIKF